jgi:hypothetical protein
LQNIFEEVMNVLEFVLGIAGGIITSLIVKMIVNTFSSVKRYIPVGLRKSLDREFRNQKCAERSILRDAKKTENMCVFALKGGSFCDTHRGPKSKCLTEIIKNENNINQKYLISSLNNPYIAIRARELNSKDLINGIDESINNLKKAESDTRIEGRLHNEVVRERLIIFDKCLYISYQSVHTPGCESPVFRFKSESSGYSALKAYFDDLWAKYERYPI